MATRGGSLLLLFALALPSAAKRAGTHTLVDQQGHLIVEDEQYCIMQPREETQHFKSFGAQQFAVPLDGKKCNRIFCSPAQAFDKLQTVIKPSHSVTGGKDKCTCKYREKVLVEQSNIMADVDCTAEWCWDQYRQILNDVLEREAGIPLGVAFDSPHELTSSQDHWETSCQGELGEVNVYSPAEMAEHATRSATILALNKRMGALATGDKLSKKVKAEEDDDFGLDEDEADDDDQDFDEFNVPTRTTKSRFDEDIDSEAVTMEADQEDGAEECSKYAKNEKCPCAQNPKCEWVNLNSLSTKGAYYPNRKLCYPKSLVPQELIEDVGCDSK